MYWHILTVTVMRSQKQRTTLYITGWNFFILGQSSSQAQKTVNDYFVRTLSLICSQVLLYFIAQLTNLFQSQIDNSFQILHKINLIVSGGKQTHNVNLAWDSCTDPAHSRLCVGGRMADLLHDICGHVLLIVVSKISFTMASCMLVVVVCFYQWSRMDRMKMLPTQWLL